MIPDPPGAHPGKGGDLDEVVAGAEPEAESKAPKKSMATMLVDLARQRFDLGVTPEGEPFALPKSGPRLVRMLRGGRGSLRAELARVYFQKFGSAPSQGALADALQVITGMANQLAPESLHLRVARSADVLVLDLGDATGEAVLIGPQGWTVDQPAVLFRRTELTAALPKPQPGGSLDELWALLNVAERHRPVLAAVLVAALMPHIPHPITALVGEQGTGKTSAMKMLAALIDPSPAQVRKAPRDAETWTTAAAGSWVVALDNMSGVPDQISDALCRASTGDGDVRRRLYSDGELHVIAFLRVVLLNGIDLGALNDDLVDRLVTIALDRLADDKRRTDADLTQAWRAVHPGVLGALLDLTCAVLSELPTIELSSPPRMADFGYVLGAVDRVLRTTGMDTYLTSRTAMAEEVATSDPVLAAVVKTITTEWIGTSADLLPLITPHDDHGRACPPKDWPNARHLTTILRRRAPSLRRLGWTVEEAGKDPRARALRFQLIPAPQDASRGTEDARNARDARTGDVSPDQNMSEAASDGASDNPRCERHASDVARNPDDARSDARTGAQALTSTNGVAASVASETSDLYPSAHTSSAKCGCEPPCPEGRCLLTDDSDPLLDWPSVARGYDN